MSSIMDKTKIEKRELVFKRVWGLIENYRYLKKLPVKDLAVKMHVSQSTVYNRREQPKDMSLDELTKYKDTLDIPDRELAEAIIGRRIIQMEGD